MNDKILYLDTSEPTATLAIFAAGEKIAEQKWEAPRELSKTLNQRYSHILKNVRMSGEDLAGICVFVGPGSFTGLRIGISFANGLAYALGIPIYGTKKQGELDLENPQKTIVPFYGAEPKITKPKKKA
jgi:tRNA threonylcarbamoyladenosine biosynthesis protein TsaB